MRVQVKSILSVGILGFALLLGSCLVGVYTQNEPEAPRRPARTFSREIAQDFALRRHGLYGIDLVKCKSCRIGKRKMGPLTLGAFNVLELDGLELVIPPPEPDSSAADAAEAATPSRASSTQGLLKSLGLPKEFLKAQGLPMRFSGLTINGLSVSRLEGTNVIALFSADHAEAERGGLVLSGLVLDGRPVGMGRIEKRETLRLIAAGSEIDLGI